MSHSSVHFLERDYHLSCCSSVFVLLMCDLVQPILDFDLADPFVLWVEDRASCSSEYNSAPSSCDL